MSTRRTHRKRVSTLRLSTDTTSTLPEYINVGWRREEGTLSDRPPDYPDSAEEADEDTDSDDHRQSIDVPPLLQGPYTTPLSPRRARRLNSHRRRQPASSNDPYLDSLLARSVHALEMSNTLLQSSISTQSSLSTILADDSQADNTLESSARGLSSRIRGTRDVHDTWTDDLEEISRGVEGLFENERSGRVYGRGHVKSHASRSVRDSLSSSLPTSSPVSQIYKQRRRPSLLDLSKAPEQEIPHLRLSQPDRSDLISPPPRALTQYFVSNSDDDPIVLPSTLGLRASASSHHTSTNWKPLAEASSSNLDLHATPLLPTITNRPLEPSTPAYNMLSSFVARAPSPASSASSSFTRPSFLSTRSSRNNSVSTDRTSTSTPSRSSPKKSPERNRSDGSVSTGRSSRSQTPKQILTTLPHRPMTPPTEESSSDGCPAKLTLQSLRKILDEHQPPPTPPSPPPERLRAPAFLPRTPAPVAEAGTSTATASISRLFTKAKHTSSTRPSSPPRHSAMKRASPSPNLTPAESPTTLSIPDMLGAGVVRALGGGSAPSSGRSTPKRISFAELPESYAGSRPEGAWSKFRDKKSRKGKRGDGPGKGKGKEQSNESSWWAAWLVGATNNSVAHSAGMSTLRPEERMEDRFSRSWGGRMGPGVGPVLDEWAM